MVKVKVKTTARGIQVSDEVWHVLNKLRREHGSIDKGLRAILGLKSRTNGTKERSR